MTLGETRNEVWPCKLHTPRKTTGWMRQDGCSRDRPYNELIHHMYQSKATECRHTWTSFVCVLYVYAAVMYIPVYVFLYCTHYGIVFWDPRNRLSGIRGIVFRAPADSSCGSPPNDLWETADYWVREIVFGSQRNRPLESWILRKSLCDLLRTFRGNPSANYSTGTYGGSTDTFPHIVCNDSVEDSRKFTEFCKLPRRILRKTYMANLRNFATNLWHVP